MGRATNRAMARRSGPPAISRHSRRTQAVTLLVVLALALALAVGLAAAATIG